MHQASGPLHIKFRIVHNFMASATETELGLIFEIFKKTISIRTTIAVMLHPQPPTPVATYNSIVNIIVMGRPNKNIKITLYDKHC